MSEMTKQVEVLQAEVRQLQSVIANAKHWVEETLVINDHPEMHIRGNTPDWFVGLASFVCDVDTKVQSCVERDIVLKAVNSCKLTCPVSGEVVLISDLVEYANKLGEAS